MTVARRLTPGRVHAFSRRTSRRALFLTPTPQVVKVVTYGTGYALGKAPKLRMLAFMQNTNHTQGVIVDRGELEGPAPGELEDPSSLPMFFERAHSLIARALNTHFGRGEDLWSSSGWSNVELLDRASLVEQLLYVWTQVVKDGLVAHPDLWTGFKIMPEQFGTKVTVSRPEGAFFGGRRPPHVKPGDPVALERWTQHLAQHEEPEVEAREQTRLRRYSDARLRSRLTKRQRKLEEDLVRRRDRRAQRRKLELEGQPARDRSSLPDEVTFEVGVPPGWEDVPIEETRAHFRRLLEERVAEIHAERRAAGQRFKGLAAVLAQDPRESAGDTWPTFAIDPRIACKDKDARKDAIRGLRAWRAEMREKRRAWATGRRDVVFPRGCYGLWVFHDARVQGGRPRNPPRADAPAAPGPT